VRGALAGLLVACSQMVVPDAPARAANTLGFRGQDNASATMTRVNMRRDADTPWSVPAGNFEYEWIGIGELGASYRLAT